MRALSTLSKVLVWVFLVIYGLFQALAIFAISQQNQTALKNGMTDSVYPLLPLAIATVLMLASVILFFAYRKKRVFGVVLGFAAAVMMLVVALDLGRAFPVTVGSYDTDSGLSTAKLITRHIGIAIIPVLLALAWLFERMDHRAVAAAEASRERANYDLSGSPVFKDDEFSMEHEQKRSRMKRSLKKKLDKQGAASE